MYIAKKIQIQKGYEKDILHQSPPIPQSCTIVAYIMKNII